MINIEDIKKQREEMNKSFSKHYQEEIKKNKNFRKGFEKIPCKAPSVSHNNHHYFDLQISDIKEYCDWVHYRFNIDGFDYVEISCNIKDDSIIIIPEMIKYIHDGIIYVNDELCTYYNKYMFDKETDIIKIVKEYYRVNLCCYDVSYFNKDDFKVSGYDILDMLDYIEEHINNNLNILH